MVKCHVLSFCIIFGRRTNILTQNLTVMSKELVKMCLMMKYEKLSAFEQQFIAQLLFIYWVVLNLGVGKNVYVSENVKKTTDTPALFFAWTNILFYILDTFFHFYPWFVHSNPTNKN